MLLLPTYNNRIFFVTFIYFSLGIVTNNGQYDLSDPFPGKSIKMYIQIFKRYFIKMVIYDLTIMMCQK